jgi:hypothetical protein
LEGKMTNPGGSPSSEHDKFSQVILFLYRHLTDNVSKLNGPPFSKKHYDSDICDILNQNAGQ